MPASPPEPGAAVGSMRVRQARPADSEHLCRMEMQAPRGTGIVITERRRDFFYKTSLFADNVHLVLEDNATHTLAAVLGGAMAPVRVGGRETPAMLMSEFFSASGVPRALDRGRFRLWLDFVAAARSRGARFVYGVVKADNVRALSIYERTGTRCVGSWRFFTLPVTRRLRFEGAAQVETQIDAQADRQLVERAFAAHDLFPLEAPPGGWQGTYDRFVRARISCAAASCKLWDVGGECQRVVVDLPLAYRVARPIASVVSQVFPVPYIPPRGATIATWMVHDLVVPPGASPEPLLRAANNFALEHGINYLLVGVDERTPHLLAAGRRSLATLTYHAVVKDLDDPVAFGGPLYFDVRRS